MNNRAKVVVGASVGLLAIWLILRVLMLSQAGISGGSIFYFGLPVGGIVALILLLLRLGLLNFGEGSSATVQHWPHNTAVQAPPPAFSPLAVPMSQRLQELEAMHTSGVISETEYAAKRAQIIADI